MCYLISEVALGLHQSLFSCASGIDIGNKQLLQNIFFLAFQTPVIFSGWHSSYLLVTNHSCCWMVPQNTQFLMHYLCKVDWLGSYVTFQLKKNIYIYSFTGNFCLCHDSNSEWETRMSLVGEWAEFKPSCSCAKPGELLGCPTAFNIVSAMQNSLQPLVILELRIFITFP